MTDPIGLAIPNWLDAAARSHPTKFALSFASQSWTFGDLRQSTVAAAAILASAKGDRAGRIAILAANRPGFVFAVHAATRLTVPFVPLNWRQAPDEIAWQLQDASITVLVVDEERLAAAKTACSELPVTIVPIVDLERSTASGTPPPHAPRIDLGQEAAVIYTSGTSGRPKGARLTYGNLWFSAISSALHLGHPPDDVWLASMPLFHVGGLSMLFRSIIGAVPVILHQQFDPEKMLAAIDAGATLVSVVPAMLQRMLDLRGNVPWPPGLRRVLVGGSSAPPRLIAECLRLGLPVASTYGLTEAASQVTTLLPEQAPGRLASSGLPLPLTEVRIASLVGAATPGEIGGIEVRGATLFAGYLGDEDARPVMTPDGWFQTGDVGYLDDDGYLYVVDRRDDLIVSAGENVYPAEIERVLREHPSVLDVGVIGVTDDRWGTRPVAAVVWRGEGHDAEFPESADHTSATELLRHCAERLARYKIPDRVVFVAELPRSPSGKLLRRVLREQLADELKRLATEA